MSVIRGLENVSHQHNCRAVAIGVFDGVHWGHKAIFERLKSDASELGVEALALTFEKHPSELLAPNRAPLYINTLDQRVELMQAVDRLDIVERIARRLGERARRIAGALAGLRLALES